MLLKWELPYWNCWTQLLKNHHESSSYSSHPRLSKTTKFTPLKNYPFFSFLLYSLKNMTTTKGETKPNHACYTRKQNSWAENNREKHTFFKLSIHGSSTKTKTSAIYTISMKKILKNPLTESSGHSKIQIHPRKKRVFFLVLYIIYLALSISWTGEGEEWKQKKEKPQKWINPTRYLRERNDIWWLISLDFWGVKRKSQKNWKFLWEWEMEKKRETRCGFSLKR